MKVNWNSKYTTISVYCFLVVSCIIIFYLSLSQIDVVYAKVQEGIGVLQPFFIGIVIAYLLNFIVKFLEEVAIKNKYISKVIKKPKRWLSLFIAYSIAVFLVALFIKFVLPQLIDSIVGLINDIPRYIDSSNELISKAYKKLDLSPRNQQLINSNINKLIDYIIKTATGLLPILGNLFKTLASSVWNIVIGLIVSIYLLMEKEKFIALSRKVTYGIMPVKAAEKINEVAHRSNDVFGKFLTGKIFDSFIIGILTFIILAIFKMPYTTLVSVIVGCTNIIPFFGPFIGAIPSFLIIMFVDPIKAIWFLVIILIIQQLDGNIIGPKILGNSIGISAFWILFAIMVAGKFLGLVGMVIGVPIFAVFYTLIKEFIEERLKKKGLKVETKDYM